MVGPIYSANAAYVAKRAGNIGAVYAAASNSSNTLYGYTRGDLEYAIRQALINRDIQDFVTGHGGINPADRKAIEKKYQGNFTLMIGETSFGDSVNDFEDIAGKIGGNFVVPCTSMLKENKWTTKADRGDAGWQTVFHTNYTISLNDYLNKIFA